MLDKRGVAVDIELPRRVLQIGDSIALGIAVEGCTDSGGSMAGNRWVGQVPPEEGNTVGNTGDICSHFGAVGLAGHSAAVALEAWVLG
jgi:hypothetical protein